MLAVSIPMILTGISVWAIVTLALFVFSVDSGRKRSAIEAAAANQVAGSPADPNAREAAAAVPSSTSTAADRRPPAAPPRGKNQLAERLLQAGLYRRNAATFYYAGQGVLAASLLAVVAVFWSLEILSPRNALMGALVTAISTVLFPSLYLDQRISRRQLEIRRGLPDALDILVISLEAGLSLPAALIRLSKELVIVHPLLAFELTIVQREIQLGNSTGRALRNFSARFGLDELRSLAAVATQAERYGASIVQALRTHGESLRIKRLQQAQERAQKAAVKLLIPTVLFIFPAIFVVILGPAAFDIYENFGDGGSHAGGR